MAEQLEGVLEGGRHMMFPLWCFNNWPHYNSLLKNFGDMFYMNGSCFSTCTQQSVLCSQ